MLQSCLISNWNWNLAKDKWQANLLLVVPLQLQLFSTPQTLTQRICVLILTVNSGLCALLLHVRDRPWIITAEIVRFGEMCTHSRTRRRKRRIQECTRPNDVQFSPLSFIKWESLFQCCDSKFITRESSFWVSCVECLCLFFFSLLLPTFNVDVVGSKTASTSAAAAHWQWHMHCCCYWSKREMQQQQRQHQRR